MIGWIEDHATLFGWLAILSAVTFVGSLLALPWLVAHIPRDYFVEGASPRVPWAERHPFVQGSLTVGKNVLGGLFVVAGVVMLVLPGQGVLTIIVGVVLMDFPGKERLERRLVAQPAVLHALNWLRRRSGCEPLIVEKSPSDRDP